MQHLELSDEEEAALIKELDNIVERDRYPLSPRVQTLRAILRKGAAVGARELLALFIFYDITFTGASPGVMPGRRAHWSALSVEVCHSHSQPRRVSLRAPGSFLMISVLIARLTNSTLNYR